MRTDVEIVAETNELAAYLCAELIGTGYTAPEGHKFYEATDPRSVKAWNHAVRIMEMTTATEVKDALEAVLAQKPRRHRTVDGAAIIGVLERVLVRANIDAIGADGKSVNYAGGLEVFWDDQKPVVRSDSFVFLDDDGQEWTFDQLEPVEGK